MKNRLRTAGSLLLVCMLALSLTRCATPPKPVSKPATQKAAVKRPHLLRRLLGIETPAELVTRHKPPVLQLTPPDFTALQGSARKAAFVQFLKPLIERANAEVGTVRARILSLHHKRDRLDETDIAWLRQQARNYGLKHFDPAQEQDWRMLLRRVDTVPISLALAQAANESGWGTSRFARNGNNYFGIWCYRPGCGITPARAQKGKGYYAVKRFSNAYESVRAYIHLLNTGRAFRLLRHRRAALRNAGKPVTGMALAPTLHHYSQRGAAYARELAAMIRHNKWNRFDTSS